MCGGTPDDALVERLNEGLSPRVRGNRHPRARPEAARGSIPACAGEPPSVDTRRTTAGVYPRVCGGTRGSSPRRQREGSRGAGLSPRVRGNRAIGAIARAGRGSIPACAGEPSSAASTARICRVYPRVCGGTGRAGRITRAGRGLSPRVRGNRLRHGRARRGAGSIPACAGEPSGVRPIARPTRVYPRVCGGTVASRPARNRKPGLSPRVRGNPEAGPAAGAGSGSIPACAGEPSVRCSRRCRAGVYPRVCGGTDVSGTPKQLRQGLSPRVRGNPAAREIERAGYGSIPACAGEPAPAGKTPCLCRVYPRVCGGTGGRRDVHGGVLGLSPRVRGNRLPFMFLPPIQGSIPACAGEPRPAASSSASSRVYPRVCGGTATTPRLWTSPQGLSPRVRGNL